MNTSSNMKYLATLISVVGMCLMLGGCFKQIKHEGDVQSGGQGIGIDTATVKKIDIGLALKDILTDPIKDDEPAPADKQHTMKYIMDRVNSFYKQQDDQTSCSQNYLKLRALTEQVCAEKGDDITDLLEGNHWTLSDEDDTPGKDWRYKIVDVDNVTKYQAEVLVRVEDIYETEMKLLLVYERGDWYVYNFDIETQVGFDAGVQVYEEYEVDYNERVIMLEYIQEYLDE
jgi:hypothetical protein